MNDTEKIQIVKLSTEETDNDVISAYLSMAGDTIYNIADPFRRRNKAYILDLYGGTQARLAAYWLNKRGAEGEIAHSENGISRSYESGDIPPSLLKEIVPICGVAT